MSNKQTRAYRKKNLSTRVIKGAQVPKEMHVNTVIGNSLNIVEFPAGRQPSKRRSPWKGHGDLRKKDDRKPQPKESPIKVYKDAA